MPSALENIERYLSLVILAMRWLCIIICHFATSASCDDVSRSRAIPPIVSAFETGETPPIEIPLIEIPLIEIPLIETHLIEPLAMRDAVIAEVTTFYETAVKITARQLIALKYVLKDNGGLVDEAIANLKEAAKALDDQNAEKPDQQAVADILDEEGDWTKSVKNRFEGFQCGVGISAKALIALGFLWAKFINAEFDREALETTWGGHVAVVNRILYGFDVTDLFPFSWSRLSELVGECFGAIVRRESVLKDVVIFAHEGRPLLPEIEDAQGSRLTVAEFYERAFVRLVRLHVVDSGSAPTDEFLRRTGQHPKFKDVDRLPEVLKLLPDTKIQRHVSARRWNVRRRYGKRKGRTARLAARRRQCKPTKRKKRLSI